MLMAYISSQVHPIDIRIHFEQIRNYLPCVIPASIIDKKNETIRIYFLLCNEIIHQDSQTSGRFRQNFMFIITRGYNT